MTAPANVVAGFSVRLDDLDLGMWTEATLGGMTLVVSPQKEGGSSTVVHQLRGNLEYDSIKLSRVVTDGNASIGAWFRTQARETRRMHGEIVLYGAGGAWLQRWSFIEAMPVKWSIPTLRSGDSTPLVETLEIAHQGFVESAANGTDGAGPTTPAPAATADDSKLEKAYLTVNPVSADGTSAGGPTTLTFAFNPTEYRVAKSASWMRTHARSAQQAGPLQWRGAAPSRLTMTLFLDESDSASGSVLDDVETLLSCCAPTAESLQREQPSAPHVTFGWGTTTSFTAVVHEVDVTFTLFRNDGRPCRANATVTLEQVDLPPVRQNPTSGAESVVRTHTVVAGDRLPLLAYRMYGDPALWRLLADANHLDDPLTLRAGDTLLVPAAHATKAGP